MALTTLSLYSWNDLASLFPAGTGGRRAAEQRQCVPRGRRMPCLGTGLSQGCWCQGLFPRVASEKQICWQAKRSIIASGCLWTTFTFSSTSGLRQYLGVITANQRLKSRCSSSLPLGIVRPEATKLLLQCSYLHYSSGIHFPPFSAMINQPHHGHFGGRLLHPACGAVHGALGVFPLLRWLSPLQSPGHRELLQPWTVCWVCWSCWTNINPA